MRHISDPVFKIRRFGGLIFFAALVGLFHAPLSTGADDGTPSSINCDIQSGSCTQMVDGHKVTLEIIPRPVTAMQDLTFKVTIQGPTGDYRQPYIDLNMPAMEMGKNRVSLKQTGIGDFEGTGVIVRCASNIKIWRAKITIPNLGQANFIFDVVY